MELMKKYSLSLGGSADEQHSYKLKIYLHCFNSDQEPLKVDFHKRSTVGELIDLVLSRIHQQTSHNVPSSSSISCLSMSASSSGELQRSQQELSDNYELCEIMGTLDGQTCKERRLDPSEYPVAIKLLWPKSLPTLPDETTNLTEYRFVLREKRSGKTGYAGRDNSVIDAFLQKFLQQPKDKEYPDLCMLPELTEQTLLENLRDRFNRGHIYTYIGPILVAVNPFKFFPIYNPKYAKLYESRRRLNDLPPHIFAIADAAYYTMLRKKKNQCVVISGESGSGKTESTNFLLHHLTTLSQKGGAGSGIEQNLLSGGPVLEAFGNSVTAQNNNSSRFGKFIQVNYRENGIVFGANVQIYLLEKSRITSQPAGERNYHVFYYLLAGATDEEKRAFFLFEPADYYYLNQAISRQVEGVDEKYEFKRLKQSMELVGFSAETQKRIFSILSAVLLLGNIHYVRKSGYYSDDAAIVANPETVKLISQLLHVKEEKLLSALTTKRTAAKNDVVLTQYKVAEAAATRDAMAKSLYNALFDWIVLRINQALMKKDFFVNQRSSGASTSSASAQPRGFNIGILDIFGFEDVGGQWNSFEQFCINYANERLQAYFNEHIFQFEQEEYLNQGLSWTAIEYTDNTECLRLMQVKPYGLFCLIDEECSIPKGTDETLLEKLNKYHKSNDYYEMPHKKESAFIIAHYAGKVKYQIMGFREKNKDLMRQDVVNVLKNSKSAFVRELVGTDPVAVFRWAVVRAAFRAMFAFKQAGQTMQKAASVQNLNVEDEARASARRSSESQLNALLRGDIDERKVPSFCDTSVFSTIIEHARPNLSNVIKPHEPQLNGACGQLTASDCLPSLAEQRAMAVPNGGFSRSYVRELVLNIEEQLTSSRRTPFRQKRSSSQSRTVRGLQVLKALSNKRPPAGRKMLTTVGAQFQQSLGRLMESLGDANPFFIRCIRSNNDKIPCLFDEDIILRQLRYTGMLETVRIRRAGYSVRLTYEEFSFQYRLLLPNGPDTSKDDIVRFIDGHPFLERYNIQFGHTKMFMRDAEKLLLDDQLHRAILTHILRLQSWFRTLLLRRRFVRTRKAVVKLQASIRGWLVRRNLQRQTLAAVYIQSYWRKYRAQKQYQKIRWFMIRLQAQCRGLVIRQRYHQSRSSGYSKYNIPFVRSDSVLMGSSSQEATKGAMEKIGSPVHSDEGILTKAPSQDDIPPSVSPPGNRQFQLPRFRRSDSEESSGILDNADFSDSEQFAQWQRSKQFHERSTSLDATFVVEDKRLKLVKVEEIHLRANPPSGATTLPFQHPRRPSLTPTLPTAVKAELTARLRRAASSDQLDSRSNSGSQLAETGISGDAGESSNIPGGSGVMVALPVQPSSSKATRKQPAGTSSPTVSAGSFGKAKRQLKALLSLRTESINLAESDEEGTSGYEYTHKSKETATPQMRRARLALPMSKPKAFSMVPGDRATAAALSGVSSTIHSFKKSSNRLPSKAEPCALCMKNIGGFLSPNFKCSTCKLCFHKECVEFSSKFPCVPAKTHKLRELPLSLTLRKGMEGHSPPETKWSWNLTRTTIFHDPTDEVVGTLEDLRQMSIFMFKKIMDLNLKSRQQRDTVADAIFRKALEEFHTELLSYQATLKEEQIQIKYVDLTASFQGCLSKVSAREKVIFPLTVGVNGFRGFLNEFVNTKKKKEKAKAKDRFQTLRKKRRKSEAAIIVQGHRFKPDLVHVPTYCEVCDQFMWHSEKIFICLGCRISCHKKCHGRIAHPCTVAGSEAASFVGRFFGADLASLLDDEHSTPVVLEKLLLAIELRGLFAEGLYRKTGSVAQVKQVRRKIEETPDFEQLSLEDLPVHLLTTLVKAFFRELPEPLMTYELYENFLTVAEVTSETERIRCIYTMVELLPKSNKAVLDRLMFHLARVAHQVEMNKMSSQNLAVIFAPCLLKRQQIVKAQEQLEDCARQTICIQTLIDEKQRHYLSALSDIIQLENAQEKVEENLRLIDEHISLKRRESDSSVAREMEQARLLFAEQFEFLDQARDKLIEELPPLAPTASSEDECLTSSDENNDDGLCPHRRMKQLYRQKSTADEYAVDLSIPPLLPNLVHLVKCRVARPKGQRKPTRFRLLH